MPALEALRTPILIVHPEWLLALPLLLLVLVWARLPWLRAAARTEPGGLRAIWRREGQRLAFRFAWVTLLVLALSGATLTRGTDRQATVLVVDTSASVASVRDQADAIVRTAADHLGPGDRLGVVVAAAGARIEEAPTSAPSLSRLAASLPADASDLAAGLRLAGAVLPTDYTGRVVLVSDGRQTRGDVVSAARELRARGVIVDVLPLSGLTDADLRFESLELAETAHRGEVAAVTARVYADRATGATVRMYRDDELVLQREVHLVPGRQDLALSLPVGDPGLHRYRADLRAHDPRADSLDANNSLGAVQRVVGPPRVLIVATDSAEAGLLPAALESGGAEVTVVEPGAVPADLAGWARFDAVVLANLPAAALPPGAMDLLERFVRDLGRGLAMTGGPDSFGPGGYADTPIERALPVYMDLRGRGRQPKVALALVIDKSGSMMGLKVELAKEAAVRSVRLLRPGDQAAVLAFDSVPQWVAPLAPIEQREHLEQAIGAIRADGGTEIYPALAAAFGAMRGAQAEVKHLILLTDGQSGSTGAYVELLRQMREAHVTLSTVAIGDDADKGLLEALARNGRGRYHFTADPSSVPEIFARETIMATRSILVDTHFYPAAASNSPLLRGLNTVPPLDGYVAVSPKEAGEVVLVSPEADPVLAAWQYGLGRALAWTPDLSGRWSAPWASQPATTILWGNALSWLLPPAESGDFTVRIEAVGDTAAVIVEDRGDWDRILPTQATVLGPAGQRQDLELRPAGPGRYQAALPSPEPGAYVVQATQTVDDGTIRRGEAGWVAPYPAEYREVGIDSATLNQVASAGGGIVLQDPAGVIRAVPPAAAARWPLAPLLLILAALLWPFEIAARRLALPPLPVRLPRWGPLGLRHPARSASPPRIAAESPSPAPSATGTAQRLLERKRKLRNG